MSKETQLGIESTWESMPSSEGSSSTPKAEENPNFDFKSILAIAQKLHIDFLPITWQPALNTVGDGATAEIRQSLINAQTNFAFKRYERRWEARSDADEAKEFQREYSEILVLGQPEIRGHPNIIRLEGLCRDISPDTKELSPMLVFEKTSFGDLTRWSTSTEGKTTAHDVRLKMCADVANAIQHLHMHHMIHGNIKPDNILVFKDESNNFVAKVAGFGSSTISTSQSIVHVPNSGHWTAPEWHERGFGPSKAMKMDVYSLGVLSLWLIFYETQDHGSQPFAEYLTSTMRSPLDLNRRITETFGTSNKEKRDLVEFFSETLALDPDSRPSDLTECISLLTQKPQVTPVIPERSILAKNRATATTSSEPQNLSPSG